MQAVSQPESTEYVRAKTLAARLDTAESSVWRMVRDGRLPQPTVKMGKRCTLWKWSDVERALAAWAAQGGAA